MVRFSAEKDGFFVSVYASHDCSLIAWNFSEQPSEDVFVGVSIERDGKKIHDQLVKGRFSFGDFTLTGIVSYRVSSVNAAGIVTRSVVFEKVGLGDPFSLDHAVFFNRGCAGSQRFATGFGEQKPDEGVETSPEKLAWLGKGLDRAMLQFVRLARDGRDCLKVMAYELTLPIMLEELKLAHARGVVVQVLFDCKTSAGKLKQTSQEAEAALAAANFPAQCLFRRTQPASAISHNKFMILLENGNPTKVWTGSTNFTLGGVFGQLNAAHLISDPSIAAQYSEYFDLLKTDPTSASLRTKLNGDDKGSLIRGVPSQLSSHHTSVVFSPQSNVSLLLLQAALVRAAKESVFLTTAFGINSLLLSCLGASSSEIFVLAESMQGIDADTQQRLKDRISAGALLEKQAAAVLELSEEQLSGLNHHVKFVHTKIMLIDMFSSDPICVFGSGNFSEASVTKNDENQLIVRGNIDLADQILVHLFRIFYHFRWRKSVTDNVPEVNFLAQQRPNSWVAKHFLSGSEKERTRNLMCPVRGLKKESLPTDLIFDLNVANQEPIKISRGKKGSPSPPASIGTIRAVGDGFEVSFRYDAKMVENFKASISDKERRWNPDSKVWTVTKSAFDPLLAFAQQYGFNVQF